MYKRQLVDGLKVYNNTIYHFNQSYFRGMRYILEENVLEIKNNIVRGRISHEGSAELSNNMTEVSNSWFVDPANGNLQLTAAAAEAIGAGLILDEVTEDFFGNSRVNSLYDIGAHQVTQGTILDEVVADDGQATLTWRSLEGADGYVVKYGTEPGAVSYTHLDVYKRQSLQCRQVRRSIILSCSLIHWSRMW